MTLFILIVVQGQGCGSGFKTSSLSSLIIEESSSSSPPLFDETSLGLDPLPSTAPLFNGTVRDSDGSIASVQALINASSSGDIVTLPAGTFTWGQGKSAVHVNKAIALKGAGAGVTTIKISGEGPNWGSGVISISAAAQVMNFTIEQSGLGKTTAFSTYGKGWRISGIHYMGSSSNAYFVYAGSYGLIDNCVLYTVVGNDEPIFSRGPADSWQTDSSLGTADAVYVEDTTFNGPGYVSDFNANARAVVRFNTINGNSKVDAHGVASNSPARSARHTEVYNNRWQGAGGFFSMIELRGGSGVVFGNASLNPAAASWFSLTDYGYRSLWPVFGDYQTPNDYPIKDQIGVGKDPKVGGSEPFYVVKNRRTVLVDKKPVVVIWPRSQANVNAGAIALYGSTFVENDIIQADRDFFWEVSAFDGSSGVGLGTKAQMLAITPTKVGVGFWVTDEGTWNKIDPSSQGQLYTWDGASWVLKYTPYTYPHPLRGT